MNAPDVMLDLPPKADATFESLRHAFVATTTTMIAAGYPAAPIALALMSAGASLALDVGGRERALEALETIAAGVKAANSPLTGPPAGHG